MLYIIDIDIHLDNYVNANTVQIIKHGCIKIHFQIGQKQLTLPRELIRVRLGSVPDRSENFGTTKTKTDPKLELIRLSIFRLIW